MKRVLYLAFQVADVPCKLVAVNPRHDYGAHSPGVLQHRHSGLEIHCVHSGEITINCIDTNFTLSKNDMLILPSGMYHYVSNVSSCTDRMDILIEVGSYRNSKEEQAKEFLKSLNLSLPIRLSEDSKPELFTLLGKIRDITSSYHNTFVQRERLKATCIELVLQIGIAAKELTDSEHVISEGANTVKDSYIMDEFFNNNYHGTSDMNELAKQLNMSVRQVGRKLQQTYGKSFREKMNECRLAVAIDLLSNTSKSFSEISEILGYDNPANFSNFVKRQTGRTPSQIRTSKSSQ